MLIFTIAQQQYALDTSHVVEVLPAIELQAMHGTVGAIAGVFNYQGQIIPVINMNQLFQQPSPNPQLQQRIILIKQKQKDHQDKLFGVLVEKIIEATSVQTEKLRQSEDLNQLFSSRYLGDTFLQGNIILQEIYTEHLLSDQEYQDMITDIVFNRQGEP